MKKAVITRHNNQILYVLLNEGRETDMYLYPFDDEEILGNIYVARVKDVVSNINAAFVEIQKDKVCYLSTLNSEFIFLNNKNTKKICEGDKILVQVKKDAVKTKDPVVSCQINLRGKFVALTMAKPEQVGISKKIKDADKIASLKAFIKPFTTDSYGFIVRTDAESATEQEIEEDISDLTDKLNDMLNNSSKLPFYTKVLQAESALINDLHSARLESEDEIVTDIKEVYDNIINVYKCKTRLYEDRFISLNKLFNLDKKLNDATSKNVWLKNGGYLVIEPTEALTVIDVNTGKYSGNDKDKEVTSLKINLEAAKEAARQIHLRNLSGIIIVDFINMKDSDNIKKLEDALRQLFASDSIYTTYIGMTKLGLAEITRQKVRRPLHEILNMF